MISKDHKLNQELFFYFNASCYSRMLYGNRVDTVGEQIKHIDQRSTDTLTINIFATWRISKLAIFPCKLTEKNNQIALLCVSCYNTKTQYIPVLYHQIFVLLDLNSGCLHSKHARLSVRRVNRRLACVSCGTAPACSVNTTGPGEDGEVAKLSAASSHSA